VADYLFGVAGFLPWRCEGCAERFRARSSPLRNIVYAHCPICGNLELQRIAPEHVPGVTAFIGRVLGFSALRCEPCRNKFFSVRPLRREEPVAAAAQRE
jgi:C4-type Zn-finger protein